MIRWAASGPLRRRTFALRAALSAYDAAYVALAEALDCPLVTRDERLARSAGHSALIESAIADQPGCQETWHAREHTPDAA